MKIGNLYAIRLDDMKPVRKHEVEEILDGGELIYVLESGSKAVVITDVSGTDDLRKSA
jgi:hypothetical protein